MKCNPGGQLALADIIGRDNLVAQLWETLAQQSVIMTAERRIGKTHVMKLLEEQPPEDWITIYDDLEKVQKIHEFTRFVYARVHEYLPLLTRAKNRITDAAKQWQGAEIKGYKLPDMLDKPWQEILQITIDTLMQAQATTGQQVLFLWDEVPYMLSNIAKNDGSDTAMQLLDILRSLRNDHVNFRMLITGSVGLHHVIGELNQQGYRNQPVNDLYDIGVEPLDDGDAQELARQLLIGESIQVNDTAQVASAIAAQSDKFPFYIHHIIKVLKLVLRGRGVDADAVQSVVQAQLIDDNDPWELRHYEKRLQDYYPGEHPIVKLVLDELALTTTGLTARTLLSRIKQQHQFDDLDAVRDLLVRLNKDHYLTKSITGEYTFRFSLIQRWWCIHRELGIQA